MVIFQIIASLVIKPQQEIIDKMSKSLKLKSDENEKMKIILQRIKDSR